VVKRHLKIVEKNQTNLYICLYIYRAYQDGSLVFEVRLGDVMDLICPFYDEQQSYMTSELEQYDVYRVCFYFSKSIAYIYSYLLR
jgi:hypothetical protein